MSKRGGLLHIAKVAGISGSEAHLLALLPQLVERGWPIRFLMLHEDEPGAWEFAAALEQGGVRLDHLRIDGDVDPIAFAQLVRRIGSIRPELVHTHLVHADLYGLPAATAAGVPVRFSTKHGFNEFRERRGFARADRSVARLAQVHIAISQGLADYLHATEGFGREDFEIVHYGITPGPEPDPYEGTVPRLLCIGRLIPIKGHIVLLRALAEARRTLPTLELHIAGRGALESPLRELAHDLGLSDAVRFLGHVAPIQDEIARNMAVIVPSLGEGFGMVALEAMERGRPVVASAVGGLSEIVVDGETGLLVRPGDADALAAALVEIGRDPARSAALGAASRRRAVATFDQGACTSRTEELYRDVLDARS